MTSRRMCFIAFLLPIRLSSTMKTASTPPKLRSASSSAIIWGIVLSRGRRPKVKMMSQNSQVNGQPRENCTGAVVHLQKVVARRRHFAHVGALRLLVARDMFTFGPIGKKLRPGLFCFPHEYDIGQRA